MLKHCFIITSAINTRFGVYTPADRLLQTVITIRSIKQKVPTAKIVLVEMAGIPLTEQQTKTLTHEVDVLLDFTDEESVKSMYNSTDNWDVVKNGTEIMVFGAALKMLQDDNEFEGVDRIHKISGRYVINDMFDHLTYEQSAVVDKIVLSAKRPSQFPRHMVGQRAQYMSRLWSWPTAMLDDIIKFYGDALEDFSNTVGMGQYIDIEHLLCKLLPEKHIHELQNIGIEGMIGPNGQSVKD
jgi:hypothetical protein